MPDPSAATTEARGYTVAYVEALHVDRDKLLTENERLREALREIHEFHCGCDSPGNPAKCVCEPVAEFKVLT
jgi:predicted ATP-grasp superfamily ATP-dependent carboligase